MTVRIADALKTVGYNLFPYLEVAQIGIFCAVKDQNQAVQTAMKRLDNGHIFLLDAVG